jgi:hypothetical protein
MRKILFLSLFFSLCQFSKAQSFFDLGLKGGAGVMWLYNQSVMNDNTVTYDESLSYTFGGKISFNFNESHSVAVEFLYSNLVTQTFKFKDALKNDVNRKITFHQYDIPVLYRKNGETGDYFEIGPQFSIVQSASDEASKSVMDNFKSSYTNILFGFGHNLFVANNLYATLGARFTFYPADFLTDAGGKDKTSFYPTNSTYTKYAQTIPVTAMLMLEFNYDLGYFAKSKCKRRAFMMF